MCVQCAILCACVRCIDATRLWEAAIALGGKPVCVHRNVRSGCIHHRLRDMERFEKVSGVFLLWVFVSSVERVFNLSHLLQTGEDTQGGFVGRVWTEELAAVDFVTSAPAGWWGRLNDGMGLVRVYL
jgi:hypothetical protein